MRRAMLVVSVSAAVLLTACASPPQVRHGDVVIADHGRDVEIRFSHRDRMLIRDYYRRNLPPGLARKARLPPGLEKQIYQHGSLPPGLAGRALPHELEQRLSHLPDGYARVRMGMDVVLLNRNTRIIVDLIRDIGD